MKTLRPVVTAVMLVFLLWPVVGKAAMPPEPSAAYEWLDVSLEATARMLFVHPNTVRYRLRRAGELTGLLPTDGRDAFALWLAVVFGRLASRDRDL